MRIVNWAEKYAKRCHRETNHKYAGRNYETHLQMVYDYAVKYETLINEDYRDFVLASCWTHDLIEDCRNTYNDIKITLCEEVAEITYALTNEKGKNRKERASDKYYQGILNTRGATFVKICDRLANVSYSKKTKSSMFKKYREENKYFEQMLYSTYYSSMFEELEKLLENTDGK